MTGTFGRSSSRGYVSIPLVAGEEIVCQQQAGIHEVGGLLVLTNQRLLFQPIDVSLANKLIHLGLRLIGGHTALIGHFVTALAKFVELQTAAIPAEQIIAVGVGESKAGLSVATAGGNVFEFQVAASLYTPKWSSKNAVARDELLRDISRYVG